jgi:transglutaminase-like putative cysteine protease
VPPYQIQIVLLDSHEKYELLAQQTAWIFCSEFSDLNSTGVCAPIAGIADAVARALDFKSELVGGQVFDETGRPLFPKCGHYWVQLAGAAILDAQALV